MNTTWESAFNYERTLNSNISSPNYTTQVQLKRQANDINHNIKIFHHQIVLLYTWHSRYKKKNWLSKMSYLVFTCSILDLGSTKKNSILFQQKK